jgi:[ribosomal protein S18]-alanine N-acetyltransferase
MTEARIQAGGDSATAARLHAEGFPDDPWSAGALAEMLATPKTRLLSAYGSDDAALGFILVRTVLDEAEVLTICVDPTARGQGVGGALLRAGIRAIIADGAETLFLEAAQDNRAALALYVRAGFVEIGRRRGYYCRGATKIDAVVMKLSELKY